MASVIANIDTPRGGGPYCFRVHGQIYHAVKSIFPQQDESPGCAQLMILDTEQAAQELAGRGVKRNCRERIFANLHNILEQCNPHVEAFKLMATVANEEAQRAQAENRELRPVRMVIEQNSAEEQRRYNAATANEVAVVYVGDDENIPGERLFVLYENNRRLQVINHLNKLCDPLTYPLVFPNGEDGWHPNIPRKNMASGSRERVTQKEFYSYLLFSRDRTQFNPLHHAGKLLQQYIVDSWLKVEMNRLYFIRKNQQRLRLDSVQGLHDHMQSDGIGLPGRRIVLCATFMGGPRYMVAQYQDAMSIVSKYGKPDLFVTFTCNPA